MARQAGKLDRMNLAEEQRRELLSEARTLTPMQLAARKRDGLRRIKGYLRDPLNPEIQAAGISRARAALARGRQRVRGGPG